MTNGGFASEASHLSCPFVCYRRPRMVLCVLCVVDGVKQWSTICPNACKEGSQCPMGEPVHPSLERFSPMVSYIWRLLLPHAGIPAKLNKLRHQHHLGAVFVTALTLTIHGLWWLGNAFLRPFRRVCMFGCIRSHLSTPASDPR